MPSSMNDTEIWAAVLFTADFVCLYQKLGHSTTDINNPEGLGLALTIKSIFDSNKSIHNIKLEYSQLEDRKLIEALKTYANFANDSIVQKLVSKNNENELYIRCLLQATLGQKEAFHYYSELYRILSVIAKADNKITQQEADLLTSLIRLGHIENEKVEATPVFTEENSEDVHNDQNLVANPFDELKELIGLQSVKEEVMALSQFAKVQKIRENKGMKSIGISYHCVFTGNPGTGKTSVARILAKIYKELGLIKKGHLVETDRSGLVAEYVGQTAVKTNKVIDSALDGVLFIDEAYSLVQGGQNDYGTEAISTLLKRMEDERDRLIVILAGYSADMQKFIDSNPGLQSRFSRYIHFNDYEAEDLYNIFLLNAKHNDYILTDQAKAKVQELMQQAVTHKDKNFGNARFVRNIFENTLQNQAMRLAPIPSVTEDDLVYIKAEDIQ